MKKRGYVLRIELLCGSSKVENSISNAETRYGLAENIAKKYKMGSYFDDFIDKDGTRYMDGYLYPCSTDLEMVLKDLDKTGIEYDNIDLPIKLKNDILVKRLRKRYPIRVGINVGDIEAEVCTSKRKR